MVKSLILKTHLLNVFFNNENVDMETKNCIFEVKSDSYKSNGTNKLKKENIKSYTTKNKKNKDHYKNLKFPFDKFINEGIFTVHG